MSTSWFKVFIEYYFDQL